MPAEKHSFERFFGSKLQANGHVLFSLWRPDLVDHEKGPPVLVLTHQGKETRVPMKHVGDGFWQVETDKAQVGSHYQYEAWNTGGNFMAKTPDPASRAQADGSFGPSVVVDPNSYKWKTENWKGRPGHELVIKEIHIGTFTEEGTFAAAIERLDELKDLGVTAIWLMPLAERPGGKDSRSWGYDGTLWYAPAKAYGEPDDVKRFVDECHARGISTMIDVVYNHFGPDGNGQWGTPLVNKDFKTPWGDVVDYSTKEAQDFAIENAKMWINEYRFDHLRLDAIHGILPEEAYHYETAQMVQLYAPGERELFLKRFTNEVLSSVEPDRQVSIIAENERNQRSWLSREPLNSATAVLNGAITDDLHHALHVRVTNEHQGYYEPYANISMETIATCLTEGMGFNVEGSARNEGVTEADRESVFDPATIVNFIQNHDQIGNRAFGERLSTLLGDKPEGDIIMTSLRRLLYLAPTIPSDFMGEEFGAKTPFQFFCTFDDPACREGVVKGRREEFKDFPEFADPKKRETIPNPLEETTFRNSKLNWPEDIRSNPVWQETKAVITERREKVIPHLKSGLADVTCRYDDQVVDVAYTFNDGAVYRLSANLSNKPAKALLDKPATNPEAAFAASAEALPPWSVNAAVIKTAPALKPQPQPGPGAEKLER